MLENEINNVIKRIKSLNCLTEHLFKKLDYDLYYKILLYTIFLNKFENVKFTERVFCTLNNFNDRPKCYECKENYLKFYDFNTGYSKFCCTRCSSNNKETKVKNRTTNLKKYGKNYYTQTEGYKIKNLDTLLSKYGVSNYSKSKKFKEQIKEINLLRTDYEIQEIVRKRKHTNKLNHGNENYNNIEKIRETILKKYGVEHGFLLSNKYYSKISQNLFWNLYNKLPENLKEKTYFAELPKNSKIYEFGIRDKNNKRIYIDFVISSIKFCIEFYGDIFHGNPKFFTKDDKPNFFYKNLTCEEIWKKDKDRIKFLEEKGFKILIIWEEEYHKRKNEVIKKCLEEIKSNETLIK